VAPDNWHVQPGIPLIRPSQAPVHGFRTVSTPVLEHSYHEEYATPLWERNQPFQPPKPQEPEEE